MEQILIVLYLFDSYCLELSVEVDFTLRYVVPNKDWDTTRSSMTGIVDEIVTLLVFYCDIIISFKKCFLKADNGRLLLSNQ